MSRRHSWLSLLVAIPGVAACLLALAAFFWKFVTNSIEWHPLLTAREHYNAIGRSFGDGFLTGFFLCFFLVLGALGISSLLSARPRPRVVREREWARKPISFPRRVDSGASK